MSIDTTTDGNMTEEILNRLNELLSELTESRTAYEEWKKTTPDLAELRKVWYKSRGQYLAYDAAAKHRFEASEPGLVRTPAVIDAKAKVAQLRSDLAEAEKELYRLECAGTPRDRYFRRRCTD